MIRNQGCRAAGVEFMRAAVLRMDRCALATWLVRQYAPSVVKEDERAGRAVRSTGPIHDSTIESAVLRARNHVLVTLETLTLAGRGETLARALLDRGDIVADTSSGRRVHVPVDRPNMRLADRVASLFVADFLDEPEAYCYVHHCLACGDLALTEQPRHASDCIAPDGRSIVTMGVDFFFQRTG